ncbi:MAG: hypothetical protein GY847_25500 [Proteobacteria bacterium]|nr:hypothetical protein [Pseudomonadota bacterium]
MKRLFYSHQQVVFRMFLAIAVVAFFGVREARALKGTHAIAASTWDTTVSTIVFAYYNGFLLKGKYGNGHFRAVNYNANFTSTSGRLSSQFGLNYMNYKAHEQADSAHGLSGSAVAMLGFPLTSRFPNGLPKVALNFYFGAVPSALISGQYNYLTIPFTFGFGVQLSPIKYLSIIPWGELGLSVNLDTVIKPYNEERIDTDEEIDPAQLDLDEYQVEDILAKSVSLDVGFGATGRGGLTIAVHLGNRVDLQINTILSKLGTNESDTEKFAVFIGGGLVIAWDDPVPSVLQPEKRLEQEDCESVENRFKSCPGYKNCQKKTEKPKKEGSQVNTNKTITTDAKDKKTPAKTPPPKTPNASSKRSAPKPMTPQKPKPSSDKNPPPPPPKSK